MNFEGECSDLFTFSGPTVPPLATQQAHAHSAPMNFTPRPPTAEAAIALLKDCHCNYQDSKTAMFHYRHAVLEYLLENWPLPKSASERLEDTRKKNMEMMKSGVLAKVAAKEMLDKLAVQVEKPSFSPDDLSFRKIKDLHSLVFQFHEKIAKNYDISKSALDAAEAKKHLKKIFKGINRVRSQPNLSPQQIISDIYGFAEQMLLPHVFHHGLIISVSNCWEDLLGGLLFTKAQELIELAYDPSSGMDELKEGTSLAYSQLGQAKVVSGEWDPNSLEDFQKFAIDLYVLFSRLVRWEREADSFLRKQRVLTEKLREVKNDPSDEEGSKFRLSVCDGESDFQPSNFVRQDSTLYDDDPSTRLEQNAHVTKWVLGYVTDSLKRPESSVPTTEDTDKFENDRLSFVERFIGSLDDNTLLELTDALKDCREIDSKYLNEVAKRTASDVYGGKNNTAAWIRLAFDHGKSATRTGIEVHEDVIERQLHSFLMHIERFIIRSSPLELHKHWPNSLHACVNVYVMSSLINNAVRYSKLEDHSGQMIVEAGLRTDGYYHRRQQGNKGPIYLTWSRENTDEHGTDVYNMLAILRELGQKSSVQITFSFLMDEEYVEVQRSLITGHCTSSYPLPCCKAKEIEVESSGEDANGAKLENVCFVRLVMMSKFKFDFLPTTEASRFDQIVDQGKVIMECIRIERELEDREKSNGKDVENTVAHQFAAAQRADGSSDQSETNFVVPLLVQHHASTALLTNVRADYLLTALGVIWYKPLLDDHGKHRNDACTYIFNNLPTTTSPEPREWKPIYVTTARTAESIERILRDSFHFPVDTMSINHACFTAKLNTMKSLSNSPIITFLFVKFESTLGANQLTDIVSTVGREGSTQQLRVVVTFSDFLHEQWNGEPRVSFDEKMGSNGLTRVESYDSSSRVGHLVTNSSKVDIGALIPNSGAFIASLRKAYNDCTLDLNSSALTQVLNLVSPDHGGVSKISRSRFIACCAEGLTPGELSIKLGDKLPENEADQYSVYVLQERFRSSDWEGEIAAVSKGRVNCRLVIVCKPPDCYTQECLPFLANVLRSKKICCDVVVPVREHNLNCFQDACRIADSDSLEVHAVRMYARCGSVPPFAFFVRNMPACELLSQRQAITLYAKMFPGGITEACQASLQDNIDSVCTSLPTERERKSTDHGVSVKETSAADEKPASYNMSIGSSSSIEVLSRSVCSNTIPWKSCEDAWSSGFPFSNSVLFGMILSSHFPLRILASIPPTSLFSRLLIMQRDCSVPWVRNLADRVSDKALVALLETFDSVLGADDEKLHQVKTAIAVVRWALVTFGCETVPFEGSDFALVVGAKILIDPAATVKKHGEENPEAAKRLVQMLCRLDGPDTEPHALFSKQAKVREYFLTTISEQIGKEVDGNDKQGSALKWGSALVGLLLAQTPNSPWARQSSRVNELRAWKTGDAPDEFSLVGGFCLSASAMVMLAASSPTPQHLRVVLNAILQAQCPDENKRTIRALLTKRCSVDDGWQSFETVRYLLDQDCDHFAKDDCIAVVYDLPHTSTLRVFAELLLERGRLDDCVTNLLSLGANPVVDQQFPLKSRHISSIIMRAFTDDYFDASGQAKLEELVRFTDRCLSAETRCAIVQQTHGAAADAVCFTLACWLHHPTLSIDVSAGKLNLVRKFYDMLHQVRFVAEPYVSSFTQIVRDQYYNVPVLALALTDQRDILTEASYEFYSQSFEWPPLSRVVCTLAVQGEKYPTYLFSGSARQLSASQRDVFFGTGRIDGCTRDFLTAVDGEFEKMFAAALHVRLGEGVTKDIIRRNVEFLLFAPTSAKDDEGKWDIIAIAMCVMLWFNSLGITDTVLVNALSKDNQALAKRLQTLRAATLRIERDVFLPMPGTMDLRVRVCAGTVELFGQYSADRLYTIRSLCQGLTSDAARNVESSLQPRWTNEHLINEVAKEAASLVAGASTSEVAVSIARSFAATVIFVWQQKREKEAAELLKIFSCVCFKGNGENTLAAAYAVFISISLASDWSPLLMKTLLTESPVDFMFPSTVAAEVEFSNDNWATRKRQIVQFAVPRSHAQRSSRVTSAQHISWNVPVDCANFDALSCPMVARDPTVNDTHLPLRFVKCPFFEQSSAPAESRLGGVDKSAVVASLGSSATTAGVTASSLVRVVDMRSLVSFKVEKVQKTIAAAEEGIPSFGYLCIKDGFQCYLAKTGGNGQYKIFTQQDDTISLTNVKTFSSYHRAWKFLMSINFSDDHPPTLTLDGCFLTKGLNSKWLLFIAHPTENVRQSPAMPWHVLAFHSLLHVQLFPAIVHIFELMFRWTLSESDGSDAASGDLDALTRRLCTRTDNLPRRKVVFAAVCSFLKQCLHKIASNLDEREIAEDVINQVFAAGSPDDDNEIAIVKKIFGGAEGSQLGIKEIHRHREELVATLRKFLSSFNRNVLTEILSAAHYEQTEPRQNGEEPLSYLHSVFWQPCVLVDICKPLIGVLKRYSDAQVTLVGSFQQFEAVEDKSSLTMNCTIEPHHKDSELELIEPKFGRGRLVDVSVEVGDSPEAARITKTVRFLDDVRTDRATFMTDPEGIDMNVPPSIGYVIGADILLGRNTVGCFYDDNIIEYVAARDLAECEESDRNSQMTDLRRFLECTLMCPFSGDIKWFFMQHLSASSVHRIDMITPGMEGLFDRGLMGTFAMLLGVAQALPIPKIRDVVIETLQNKLSVHENMFELCFRKNGKYGVHIVTDAGSYYDDARLIHHQVTIGDLSLPDAEKFEQIVQRFDELVTHVVVFGLTCISDGLLKWLAEYTLGYPWRWIVLVRTSTHYNWPENRDRLYFPRLSATQTDKIKPFKGNTKLIGVPLGEEADRDARLVGNETTKRREDWENIARPLEHTVTFVVSPPGAGKSKFTQALEAGGQYMIFNVDCSNPILARESINTLLDQSFPKDYIKNALLVADEFHFLDVSLKEMLFSWIRPRLSWLKVLLIANRRDAADVKIMEKCGLAVVRPEGGAPAFNGVSTGVCKVLLIDGRCGMEKMLKHTVSSTSEKEREYVGAFHCMRRALFSDEVSSLRNREKVLEAAQTRRVDSVRMLLCDQLTICEEYFPSLVATVFHDLLMRTVDVSSSDDKKNIVLDQYEKYVRGNDGPQALAVCAMLPFYCSRGTADAVLSFDEVCQEMKLDKVHPAYRFHYWCDYVHKFCGLELPTCLEGFKQMRIIVQGFFPIICAERTSYTKEVIVEAHVVPYHNLDQITDAVVRHKAMDWDGIRDYWAEHFVTDLANLEKLLSVLGENSSVCMSALTSENITMLLRGSSYTEDSFASYILKYLAATVDENSLTTCDSPWLIAAWGFIKANGIKEWRANPTGRLRSLVNEYGTCASGLCDLAESHYPLGNVARSIEVLIVTWVGEYGNCFNEVADDCVGRDECLRLMLGNLIHDVVACCAERPLPQQLERLVTGELARQLSVDPNGTSQFSLEDAFHLVGGIGGIVCDSWPPLLQLVARARLAERKRGATPANSPLTSSLAQKLWHELQAFPRASVPLPLIASIALVPDSLPLALQKWIAEDPRSLSLGDVQLVEHDEDEGVPQLRRNFVELARLMVNGDYPRDHATRQGWISESLDWLCVQLNIF